MLSESSVVERYFRMEGVEEDIELQELSLFSYSR